MDRDLIEEEFKKAQGWVNNAILLGDIEQLRQYKDIKNTIYETRGLLRRLVDALKIQEEEARAHEEELRAKEALEDSEEDLESSPYAVKKRKNKYKFKEFIHEPEVTEEQKPGVFIDLSLIKAAKFRLAFFVIILLLMPAIYFSMENFLLAPGKSLDVDYYSAIVVLHKAHRKGQNFLGQVPNQWRSLTDDEKREQVQDLYKFIQDDNFQMIVLYYPNGSPAATRSMGHVILY